MNDPKMANGMDEKSKKALACRHTKKTLANVNGNGILDSGGNGMAIILSAYVRVL